MDDNILVPKHEVLPLEEAEKLLEKLKARKDELPKIKTDDPGISKLEVEVGDIIKITRKHPIIGSSLYYRVVIQG